MDQQTYTEEFPLGECCHCGNTTTWIDDPAPDLCHLCAMAGRWSTLWGPDRLDEYQAAIVRLYEKRMRDRPRKGPCTCDSGD